MGLYIWMYSAAPFGGIPISVNTCCAWKLLATKIRLANAARNHCGSFRHRQVALAKQLARLLAGKIEIQEALRGVAAVTGPAPSGTARRNPLP